MSPNYAGVHKSPNGPGDARPTAQQIITDQGLEYGSLAGKSILITGCSSGIGVEAAKALSVTGATLYLTARDLNKAKKALGDLATAKNVTLLELDLNSLDSVRACAKEFASQSKQLNIFIANAGVMATPEGRTADGFETQFGTNHLAHFLLFNLLAPTLVVSATSDFESRAIILSSIAHRFGIPDIDDYNLAKTGKPYDANFAYTASKTYNLWTANEIERRFGNRGLHAWSVQPGGVNTGLSQHMDPETLKAMTKDTEFMKIFKNPEQGAATSVWGAIAKELEGKGGRYLEDCGIAEEWKEENGLWGVGYAAHAYDEAAARKTWKKSLELCGLPAEE